MQGSSRSAFASGGQVLSAALDAGTPAEGLAEDLFGVLGAIDASATLRRALADPSRGPVAKSDLVDRLFGGKVGAAAVSLLQALAAQRWSAERDLADAVESFGVQALVAGAESAGRADRVEDELFRFERIVAANSELRDVLTDRAGDAGNKSDVVGQLLEGKVAPETLRLARQSVLAPRGRRFDRTIREYLEIAASRRRQLSATVTAAAPLTGAQQARLVRALEGIYAKTVHLNVVHDPQVLGGIHVRIGDEVVDGTILRKLDAAKRHFGV